MASDFRWLTLGASTGLELLAGLGFTFSLYAPHLKEVLHLSQPQLQGLGTAMLCGGLFGIVPGLVYDKLYTWPRLGPRITALTGMACHLVGYSILWATVSGRLRPGYALLVLNGLLLCNGPSWSDTVANVINVQNFSAHRGAVAGILKGIHGISPSIFAGIFAAFFAKDITSFLLFLALGPPFLCLPAILLLKRETHAMPVAEKSTGQKMLWIIVALLVLYAYQMLCAVVRGLTSMGQKSSWGLAVGSLLFLSAIVIATAWPLKRQTSDGDVRSPLLSWDGEPDPAESRASHVKELLEAESLGNEGQDPSLLQAASTLDFWLLFSALLIGMGFGITVSNNLGLQVLALGGSESFQSLAVLVFSTVRGFGCLIVGPLSENLYHRVSVGRTAVLAALSGGTAIASLLLSVSRESSLLPCVALAGFVSGGHWPLFPSCTADLFGRRHFAAIRGLMHVSSPMGTALLSIGLTGKLYEVARSHHERDTSICKGSDCFRNAYLIIAGLAGVQTVLSIWLHIRSRHLYARLRTVLITDSQLQDHREVHNSL